MLHISSYNVRGMENVYNLRNSQQVQTGQDPIVKNNTTKDKCF